MLSLAKVPDAKRAAAEIVAFETKLAKAQWSNVECRDSTKTYNRKTRDELAKLAPAFDWNLYFTTAGIEEPKEVIVAQPSFFTALSGMLDSVPLSTWKAWLKWQVIREYASLLNKEMADADFAFYGTTLHGIPQNRPRWKRAVGAVDGALGQAVGKLYVEKYFPPDAKARMDRMVQNIIAAYRRAFQTQRLDEPRNQAEGVGQAGHLSPENRLPEEVARLLVAENPPRRLGGQHRAGVGVRVEPHDPQARQTGGPRRVAHDAADGQRLLQRST